jgi:hypothetical protein
MRVRTGRREKLRSAQAGNPKTVEVRDGEHPIQAECAVAPPAMSVAGNLSRHVGAGAQGAQFTVHGRASTPERQPDSTQVMAQPFVESAPDVRRLRQLEVRLPPDRNTCRSCAIWLMTSRSGQTRRPFRPQGEISPGKNAILHRTVAPFTPPRLDHESSQPFACSPCSAAPQMRFVYLNSRFRSTLPSHVRSPSRSCASLRSLWSARGRTCTSKIAPMLGARKKRRVLRGAFCKRAAPEISARW